MSRRSKGYNKPELVAAGSIWKSRWSEKQIRVEAVVGDRAAVVDTVTGRRTSPQVTTICDDYELEVRAGDAVAAQVSAPTQVTLAEAPGSDPGIFDAIKGHTAAAEKAVPVEIGQLRTNGHGKTALVLHFDPATAMYAVDGDAGREFLRAGEIEHFWPLLSRAPALQGAPLVIGQYRRGTPPNVDRVFIASYHVDSDTYDVTWQRRGECVRAAVKLRAEIYRQWPVVDPCQDDVPDDTLTVGPGMVHKDSGSFEPNVPAPAPTTLYGVRLTGIGGPTSGDYVHITNHKITAIKAVRTVTGLDLKEAKNLDFIHVVNR